MPNIGCISAATGWASRQHDFYCRETLTGANRVWCELAAFAKKKEFGVTGGGTSRKPMKTDVCR